MNLDDYDYALPPERIAQEPAPERDAARLLVHRLGSAESGHARVRDLDQWLEPGDLLVVNDTRVLCARAFARRASGGRVELFFLEALPERPGCWRALVNPARKLRVGEELSLEGSGAARVVARKRGTQASGKPGPHWVLEWRLPEGEEPVDWLEAHGSVPLPPYIERRPPDSDAERAATTARPPATEAQAALDRERYQTVWAEHPGAVAAPTAGLHFTPELLARLEERGVARARVTLHVGEGTFRPLGEEELARGELHPERFELPAATVEAVAATRRAGGRVVAVGTTVTRVLESCAREDGSLEATRGETRLFLRPGDRFRVVDALFTNFHLPKSSLLLLVSAFAGRERVLALYAEAIARGYRFYSYGDAMLLLGAARPPSAV